jgi:hypothetical protein
MVRLPGRVRTALSRLRWAVGQEIVAFRRWLENTRNFIHFSLLLVLPLLIALVTLISNRLDVLPFLLFPPLASGGYTLFTHPESRYASPRRFVGGMTIGALCGWLALEVTVRLDHAPTETFQVQPGAAALGILLTGVLTWALDLEESQAFSTALLVLVVGVTGFVYVASVFLSASLVAAVFVVWRHEIYERRAEYLYQTTHGDDHVLVPMRGDEAPVVASFGAYLAAAHEAGKVVLLGVVDAADAPDVESDGGTVDGEVVANEADGETADTEQLIDTLESRASLIRDRHDVPCEVTVATGDPDDAGIVTRTAARMNCDLIATPYESEQGHPSQFVRTIFRSRLDAVVVRPDGDREQWRRILVPIKDDGETAHAMLDFAGRLAGEYGRVAVCHCIDSEKRRRDAEEMLANLVETFDHAFETRVTTAPLEEFLSENGPNYDLTVVGASTDRTLLSRAIDPPTFETLSDIDCDVAVVHRGDPTRSSEEG